MNAATGALLITLANAGYWFGGSTERIEVRWAVRGGPPACLLEWRLSAEEAKLADGRFELPADDEAAILTLKIPEARTRTVLCWEYALRDSMNNQILSTGERTIKVFPNDSLTDLAGRLRGKRILGVGMDENWTTFLKAAEFDCTYVDQLAQLAAVPADIILIGLECPAREPFWQRTIEERARNGASVMILAQQSSGGICGFPLQRRRRPADLSWFDAHPLLAECQAADWATWFRAGVKDIFALQLPADAAALEIVHWPRETPGDTPAPLDALLAVQAIEGGRIVFCQLPLGDWRRDPLSRQFMRNALEYLATRVEPTPPPSRRTTSQLEARHDPPTIQIPAGVER